MLYRKYVEDLKKCPFCDDVEERILAENEGAFLTYAKAPYHKYHLLVLPKRHVESIKDLTWDEDVCIMALIVAAIKTLDRYGHNDCGILARDAKSKGKSIKHLHYHIIPGGQMADISVVANERDLLTKGEEAQLREELKTMVAQGN